MQRGALFAFAPAFRAIVNRSTAANPDDVLEQELGIVNRATGDRLNRSRSAKCG